MKHIKARIKHSNLAITADEAKQHTINIDNDHSSKIIELSNMLRAFNAKDIWYALTLAGINPVDVAGINNLDIAERLDAIETVIDHNSDLINHNSDLIIGKLKKLEKSLK